MKKKYYKVIKDNGNESIGIYIGNNLIGTTGDLNEGLKADPVKLKQRLLIDTKDTKTTNIIHSGANKERYKE